ncbi:MAG: hypothetical protein CML16_03035 [Pusillimonas sp.]|nr:hypothetical protein [Pusillimonas sp.]MBC43562.1 hypothetical protein [Pusillimonas sp.]HCP78939.1 hypothetical protein [Pusillimonas sp.]|tara:strand:- start:782 stop:1177 length:396 start_codon:yes stop_codon:yes gene_type:complete
MATSKIRLVQGDTRPQLIFSLTDETTGSPIDLSGGTTTIRMLFREAAADDVKATMPCYPIAGYRDPETGIVDNAAPYDVAGKGGRCVMNWSEDALDTAGEYEGEVEVSFDAGEVQTAYDIIRFTVREQFNG